MKLRFPAFLTSLALLLSACNLPSAVTTTPTQTNVPAGQTQAPIQISDTSTPVPDTATPPAINAPLAVDLSFVKIHFLNEEDGWGVTDAQIVRTPDGGFTWYNVTPPNVAQAGFGA